MNTPFARFGRFAFSILLLIAMTTVTALADSKPGFLTVDDGTTELAHALAVGVTDANSKLSQLGKDVAEALDEQNNQKVFFYSRLSARDKIEMLYQRAEIQETGQGTRFLARLRAHLATTSAAVAEDPKLKFLEMPADKLALPIKFASVGSMPADLIDLEHPKEVEDALRLLSEYVTPNGIGHLEDVILRHLRLDENGDYPKARSKLSKIVSNADSTQDVLLKAVRAHTPPPNVRQAVKDVVSDFASNSAAFAIDPKVREVMTKLSSELTDKEKALEKTVIVPAENRVNPDNSLIESSIEKSIEKVQQTASSSPSYSFPSWAPQQVDKLTQKHTDYVSRSFELRPGATAPIGPTIEVGHNPVPLKYAEAILSSRAARGIAVGANVNDGISRLPLKAYWFSDRASEQFGRIIIEFNQCQESSWKWLMNLLGKCDGQPVVAVTDRIFSDSFFAANQLLWGNLPLQTKFVEGDISVLMSMDPDLQAPETELLKEKEDALQAQFESESAPNLALYEKLRNQLITSPPTNSEKQAFQAIEDKLIAEREAAIAQLQAMETEFVKEHYKFGSIPHAIVLHPAVQGRQLAWAAARVDFWINGMDRLFGSAKSLSDDKDKADEMNKRFQAAIEQANEDGLSTWQYYEVDADVRLDEASIPAKILVTKNEANRVERFPEARFSINLFGEEKSSFALGEHDRKILSSLAIEEPLFWLQSNHPDFIRLRDFSTSLMLLRYLKNHNIKLLSPVTDDNFEEVQTPEWIFGDQVEPVVNPLKPR